MKEYIRDNKEINIAKRTNSEETSSMADQFFGRINRLTAEKVNAKEWMRLE